MGFPEDVLKVMDFEEDLKYSTLLTNTGSSKAGAHFDPSCPLPALIAGPTVNTFQDDRWRPSARGGRLVLVDGLVDLSYGPRDVVILNGNYMHAVTELRDLPGPRHQGQPELTRFSIIIFNGFKKMKVRHGYLEAGEGTWNDKWRSSIPLLSARPQE